jgi:hypothetical protein
MLGSGVKAVAIGLVSLGMLAAPTVSSAQGYAARCDESSNQRIVYDDYGRAVPTRAAAYGTNRVVARRSAAQSVERVPERTKTKSAHL